MSIVEWAEKYRWLSTDEGARPGKYRFEVTPHLIWPGGPLEALEDPAVSEIVARKSAQVAWTSGVLGNALGKWIDIDPSPILILFPMADAVKQYVAEKLEPMIKATPRLRKKVDLNSRKLQQRQGFKRFPGGFLKMVGSNSPASVKSTPVPRVAIEEPDDCNLNLRGQGDSIKLAKERLKTFRRSKIIIGGTPTIKGLSAIDAELELSDKRVGLVPCHECGQEHALSFDNLHCDEDPDYMHAVYGKKRPEKAFYSCPHCGAIWDDNQKNANLKHGRWSATAEFRGIAGYILNELYATFYGSRFEELMKKKLNAEHEASKGNIGPMIAFVNSNKGESYEYQSNAPKTDELEKRAEPYAEFTAPKGTLLVTVGVDVQGDRLALVIVGWGRGEESWRLYWGELPGNPIDPNDGVWTELDRIIATPIPTESGAQLAVSAVSVDSSDGNTSDAVYTYVRDRQRFNIMAIKGASIDSRDREIFTKPAQSADTSQDNTKAAKYGLRVFIVGTHKAKTLIDGRMRLKGSGPGRMHWYSEIRADYYEQVTNEVLAPHPRNPSKMVWLKKAGRRNEALDCEVYALHAARSLKTHLLRDNEWDQLEQQQLQPTLFTTEQAVAPVPRRVVSRGRGTRSRVS
ncbi:phage terminase large subunit family protein [Pseudomonas chlororaphis]|uniref:Phage terminase GpA n=1 Tax=Pseudomonas chlororaphis TaxID=587753 RepID=A0AAX3G760_9PSED|nr:terminase gpA endonuclease subunit [Pseudomonas chlororaphis]AZC37095.1 Phage terminase, large subunit [Pseudomonas chlororaphis subsp. piscium]AZC43641.1 Phage terminase, large subunit [Pseudomonas chlororaphis subsp. piscium]WDG75505.1 phage terminase large subunit family protein [Pseudomonas chlororaphis]WDH26859.1 phage terminase large subunit family protein [Pseudomonas chlororaphis]WDH74025.1 phage terminase large subunit family protein [Pseudomonas chlororaphis]